MTNPAQETSAGEPATIAITGAGGLVGRHLTASLKASGVRVLPMTRGERGGAGGTGGAGLGWNPETGEIDAEGLRAADVVVHLAGAPVAGRFTPEHKRDVRESRRAGTRLIAETLARLADDGRPRALVSASASGWYGPDRGDEWLTEDMPSGTGFLAEVCREWEAACGPARVAGVRVVNVRTGIVQARDGGQLKLQLPMFRLGVGGPLGDGRQWMPWIHIDDLVGIYRHAASSDSVEGPINACAPGIVRNREYSEVLGRVLHRPAKLRVPRLGPALLLGREGADEFALAGQRMSARKVEASADRFVHPDLEPALRSLVQPVS